MTGPSSYATMAFPKVVPKALRRRTMPVVAGGVLELVGNTPLVQLRRVVEAGWAEVLGKMEALNPGGSTKDRVALALVEDNERRGLLTPGSTLVIATSGNTGISLALIAAAKGYKLAIFLPETTSAERRRLLVRYGVDIHLTPAYLSMDGAYAAAKEMAEGASDCVYLDIFSSPVVVAAHREGTGAEIIDALDGQVDAFVAGVGTGGTIMGVGERLREANPSVLLVAVEPAGSQVLAHGTPGAHMIPGIGADFVPPLLNRELLDEIYPVGDEEASQMALRLAREEGLPVGISSGANVVAAVDVARRLGSGKRVVTILADIGERYVGLSA